MGIQDRSAIYFAYEVQRQGYDIRKTLAMSRNILMNSKNQVSLLETSNGIYTQEKNPYSIITVLVITIHGFILSILLRIKIELFEVTLKIFHFQHFRPGRRLLACRLKTSY